MTPQDIITVARDVLLDTDAAAYRQSDAELLRYVNDGIREAAIVQPSLFSTVAQYTCTVGQCEQAITFTNAFTLLEVLCIHNGNALTPFDVDTMNAFNPGWRTDTAGTAKQWARFTNDVLRFFVYPKAPATAQVLDVRYVKTPTASYALSDTITELPDGYLPALADYVASRASVKDDEFTDNNRATALYQSFVAKMKGA